ncbi:MAG: transcription antitermination factor NusB [Myxococcota bacterium]
MNDSTQTRELDARGRGRELVLGALCHLEDVDPDERSRALGLLFDGPPTGDEIGETRFADLAADRSARKFAESLVGEIITAWDAIDDAITAASRRWRLERMDRVDRNALRIAAAELRGRDRTPRGVVLSEAVRLASTYGNEKSASFVNGLAASLASQLRPENADQEPG